MSQTSITTILLSGLLLGSLYLSTPGHAATYYAGPSGKGSCVTNRTKPGSLTKSLGCLKPGDRLELAGGSYPVRLTTIPAGTSWDKAVTIAGAPGATAILNPSASGEGALVQIRETRYVILDNLTIDAAQFAKDGTNQAVKIEESADHIRIQNSTIGNARGVTEHSTTSGILTVSPGHNEFRNLDIAGNLGYGIYLTGANNLVEHCRIHDNSRYGLHVYNDSGGVDNNVIRQNRIYRNGARSVGCWGGCTHPGMVVSSGRGNRVYNNFIHENANGGIQVEGEETHVDNNTILDNQGDGCLLINTDTAVVRNNICWQNGRDIAGRGRIDMKTNLTTNPRLDAQFVPQPGSPAIKAGADLSDSFTTDIRDMARPKGKFDLGAFAVGGRPATTTTPSGRSTRPAPRNLRLIVVP